jgi:hypothetical protein
MTGRASTKSPYPQEYDVIPARAQLARDLTAAESVATVDWKTPTPPSPVAVVGSISHPFAVVRFLSELALGSE